jgi:uncharacterized protein YjbI with pentapeptide repeats
MRGNGHPEEIVMANEEHLARLKDAIERNDVADWNLWREENRDIRPDLTGMKLSEAGLRSADLSRADLSGADLSMATLVINWLENADLDGILCRSSSILKSPQTGI